MGVEFYITKQQKARKRHKCHICGKDILPGREYIFQKYRDERGFQELRRHIHCDAILNVCLEKWRSDGYLDDYYDEDEVEQEIHESVCKECGYDTWENCRKDCFSCEICQKHILGPTELRAAIQSVRENADD